MTENSILNKMCTKLVEVLNELENLKAHDYIEVYFQVGLVNLNKSIILIVFNNINFFFILHHSNHTKSIHFY